MPEILGTDIALAVVVISIILSGIAIGIGRGFGYKKIERFGLEELGQAIINAALVGAIVGVIALISSITASFIDTTCADGNPIGELECALNSLGKDTFLLFQETSRALELLGYYQTLTLDFGFFSLQPLSHLQSIIGIFSDQTTQLQFLLMLSYLQFTLAAFVKEQAFAYLLSAGLVFRAFFATRKLGAFLLALFLGLYIFYPLLVLLFPVPDAELASAVEELKGFNENPFYATPPILDLNDNLAIAEKLDAMRMHTNVSNTTVNATNDLTGDLTILAQANAHALGKLWVYLMVAPLLSLVFIIVLVKELTFALSAEIGFSMEAI